MKRPLRFGLLLGALIGPAALAQPMQSPWWEDYAVRDRYLCRSQGVVVVERNEAQASLIQGRYRSTLFREASDQPGIRYSGDGLRLILLGDELTVEQLPQRILCLRTDQV